LDTGHKLSNNLPFVCESTYVVLPADFSPVVCTDYTLKKKITQSEKMVHFEEGSIRKHCIIMASQQGHVGSC